MNKKNDPSPATYPSETEPGDDMRATGSAGLLRSFFPLHPGEFAELWDAGRHPMVFDRHRARFILSRAQLMATLFSVLTPLWIPLDMLVFPRAAWQPLALGRIIASAAFALLALSCRRATTLKQAYAVLAALFFIPAVFFLFSHSVLWGVSLSRLGATMASGYAFLPFVMVAGLSIFPLTVLELTLLALPLLAIAGIPVLEQNAFMMPTFNAVAVLWLLVLVTAVGSLSAVSQLQLLRTMFASSVIDPLTGVLNRRSGIELIALQFALARRHGYPLAIAFMDLDDFKQVNDSAGHDGGDRLLEQTAQAWRRALRKSDTILRWGGEEFILLLPYTDCAQAERLVRSHLPALKRPDGKPLTYSIGIAEWSSDTQAHWQPLVALADQRMYQAKTTGKARIVACAHA